MIRSCEKCRHLVDMYLMAEFLREGKKEAIEMIWTCMCKAEIKMRPRERYYNRWKAKSRQTKAEMARPGERGYGPFLLKLSTGNGKDNVYKKSFSNVQ